MGAACLFEREHHRRVASVLQALDGHRLHAHQCLFGGGTALALRYGEYRESVDIDFLVSHREGYRALRQLLTGEADLQRSAIPADRAPLEPDTRCARRPVRPAHDAAGGWRGDQVRDRARSPHHARRARRRRPGVRRRHADAAGRGREQAAGQLRPLARRRDPEPRPDRPGHDGATEPLLRQAIVKAQGAYGASIEADLHKAIQSRANARTAWTIACRRCT